MADTNDEQFTFFFVATNPFCQWYPSKFILDNIKYNCTEQYMMYQKALLFNDLESAKKIMATEYPDEQKLLGRKVKGFNDDIWITVCKDLVKKANIAKFSQNLYLKKYLFKTAGTTIVEASPYDCRWGIGYSENDPKAKKRETWRGDNWLGEILTNIREELMALKEEKQDSDSSKNKNEKFIFFWGGPFSQWYSSSFTIDNITYNTAEQYMMHQKALLFKDYESAKAIMNATDPSVQKQFGREVRGFNDDIWVTNCKPVVRKANRAKFTQSAELKDILLKTDGDTIVEASPTDRRWGIGLMETDPRRLNRDTWRGENWLGEIIMDVREEIMQEMSK